MALGKNKTDIPKEKIEKWERELSKCIRCGTCRKVCPIHAELDDESYTARGKLYLVDQLIHGDFLLSDEFVGMISKCVMCKGCAANCPSGVNTYDIFMEMRQEIVRERGLSFTKQSIFRALYWRSLFDFGLTCGSWFQRILFQKAPDGHGQIARVPLPMAGFNQRRIIPNLPKKHLRHYVPEIAYAEGEERYKVAFFSGCMMNYVYPEIGADLVAVLQHHGVTVVTPRKQYCCGTPLFTSGETDIAREMIHRNLELFLLEKPDYIIVGCGSCGTAWKQEFPNILGQGHADYYTAKALGEKTRDISEFLMMLGLDVESMAEIPERITYHDSCHLNRGQKIHNQPRQILKSLPGCEFIEMEKADACCGSGGSFNLAYYELSRNINHKKTTSIANTEAEVCVVGCPACLMHIRDGLSQDNIPVDTRHIVELLALRYGFHGQPVQSRVIPAEKSDYTRRGE